MTRDDFLPKSILTGSKTRASSFGWVVNLPGDLDGDGYPDLAVSAPFEVIDDRVGAVYIFNGYRNLINSNSLALLKETCWLVTLVVACTSPIARKS